MKLRLERIGRDHLGKPLLPELSGNRRLVTLRIIEMLEENPEKGITGYKSMSQLQAFLMVAYWKRYDKMPPQMTIKQFEAWFIHPKGMEEGKATFPDFVRRAVEWLVKENLVEVPPDVLRDAKEKAKYMQGSFAGVKG